MTNAQYEKGPYRLDPHKHVKIWLSPDPDVFMNETNQLRLIQMRLGCAEHDEISLIYDATLLTEHAVTELKQFCATQRIIPLEINMLLSSSVLDAEERELVAIYQDEVQHLDAGGNLGAASDILRWLRPVYENGVYSDADVLVETRDLPDYLWVERPVLFNLGTEPMPDDQRQVRMNNDIIAVVDPACQEVKQIQRSIINASKGLQIPGLNPMASEYPPRQWRALIPSVIFSSAHVEHEYKYSVMYSTGPFLVFRSMFGQLDFNESALLSAASATQHIDPYSLDHYPGLTNAFQSNEACLLNQVFANDKTGDKSWIPSERDNLAQTESSRVEALQQDIKSRLKKMETEKMETASPNKPLNPVSDQVSPKPLK